MTSPNFGIGGPHGGAPDEPYDCSCVVHPFGDSSDPFKDSSYQGVRFSKAPQAIQRLEVFVIPNNESNLALSNLLS